MEKLNMSYEELKEIVSTYELETLDSLNIILKNVRDYDLTELVMAFNGTYRKAWSKSREEFEGMNEYDFLTKLHNFDITEIVDTIDETNQNELNCFKSLIANAINNIKETDCAELEILPKLAEAIDRINIYLGRLDQLENPLNNEELKTLFNKYNIVELKAFDIIFKYVYNYDMAQIINIKNEVKEAKQKECFENYEVAVEPCNLKLSDLAGKNHILDIEELKFLEELLDNASENVVIKDFENHGFPVKEITNLHQSFVEEIDNRKIKKHKKTR